MLCGRPQNGRKGVEAEWEQTEAFLERWKLKARELLAKMEFRKRKTAKRVRGSKAVEAVRGAARSASFCHKAGILLNPDTRVQANRGCAAGMLCKPIHPQAGESHAPRKAHAQHRC